MKEKLLTLDPTAMFTNTPANSAGAMFGDTKNPRLMLDNAFNVDGPSNETLLDSITTMTVDEIHC